MLQDIHRCVHSITLIACPIKHNNCEEMIGARSCEKVDCNGNLQSARHGSRCCIGDTIVALCSIRSIGFVNDNRLPIIDIALLVREGDVNEKELARMDSSGIVSACPCIQKRWRRDRGTGRDPGISGTAGKKKDKKKRTEENKNRAFHTIAYYFEDDVKKTNSVEHHLSD